MKQRVKVIGITGGIASGKSTIAKMLGSLGAVVVDADKICHQLIDCKEAKLKIVEKWGANILTRQGKVSRRKLGGIVFDDVKELSALNKIIHPKVIKLIKNQISGRTNSGKTVVIDAALLVETDLTKLCDIILFVDTNRQICVKRAAKGRKWLSNEKDKRERFQAPVKEKRKIANIVINNNSTKESTLNQVKDLWTNFIIK